jgi:hypothetical protein
MFQITRIIKWLSIPAILIASLFARYAAAYELTLNLVVCLGAVGCVRRAVQLKEYSWAAGFVSIAVVFSPLLLVDKIFFLMGLTCVATFMTLIARFRTHPVPAAYSTEIL